jgi:hypothetical protein
MLFPLLKQNQDIPSASDKKYCKDSLKKKKKGVGRKDKGE